jgi:hypothetical protein
MAYHVNCNKDTNIIFAGTINKKGDKWIKNSPVTEECLLAVREHLLNIAKRENVNEIGFHWDMDDGTMIALKVIVMDAEETKKFKENLKREEKEE